MGIYIGVEGRTPRRGVMRRPVPTEELLPAVVNTIREAAPNALMQPFMYAEERAGGVAVGLHPAAEPLEFSFSEPGRVKASMKTSTVGPGLHEYAVSMLRRLEDALGVRWEWEAADGEDDGSNFAVTKDFGALQRAMAAQMKAMMNIARTRASDADTLALNLGLHIPLPMDGGVSTPMGRFSWDRVDAIIASDGETLHRHASDFFPWWESGMDGEFLRNLAVTMMWTEVPWRPPADERERLICRIALGALDAARQLEPHMRLPESEMAELRAILEAPEGSTPPAPKPEGIGYRRRPVQVRLPGGWQAVLPGYYRLSPESGGQTMVYEFGERMARFTIHAAPGQMKRTPTREGLVKMLEPDDAVQLLERNENGLVGVGAISREPDASGTGLLRATVAAHGGVASCVVLFEQPGGEAWAQEVFASLRCAGGAGSA